MAHNIMSSVFQEPSNVENYYKEFVSLIEYYKNLRRPSVFIKYYNIDDRRSSFDSELKTTYDIYNSDIRFNIYSLTPTIYLLPITNMTSSIVDLNGMMYDGLSSIVVYTIDTPKVHDLIEFYPPIQSKEIFRVVSIRSQINAIHSEPSIKWFELQLEYAPLKTIENLKIEKHFVYDFSNEKYVEYNIYTKKVDLLNQLQGLIVELNKYYNEKYDLYITTDKKVLVETNEVVYFFKNHFSSMYTRLFENLKTPYGYESIVKDFFYGNLESISFKNPRHYNYFNLNEPSISNTFYWDENDDIILDDFRSMLAISKTFHKIVLEYFQIGELYG